MKAQTFFIFICFLLAAAVPAGAEMYHWVDGAGTNHYANSPPLSGIKAENSWPEIKYDAAAGAAQAAGAESLIKALKAQDAAEKKSLKAKARADKALLKAKLSKLQAEQERLADDILADRRNIRRKAEPLTRRLERINKAISAAEDAGKKVERFEAQRRTVWDALFTERYMLGEGRVLMKRYRSIGKKIRDLK